MSLSKIFSDIWAIFSNEFRVFRNNKAAIIISLIVLPLFFTSSLGGASGGAVATFSPTADIPIAFIDNDLSVASGRLYNVLVSSGDFNILIQGYREDNAIASLGKGTIYAVIIIPKGFEENLLSDQVANIVCYIDDGEPGLSNTLLSTLRGVTRGFDPTVEVQLFAEDRFNPIDIILKGAIFSGFSFGLTIIIGLVVIFATFYEIAGGMSREREEGTYARLLMSPVSLGAIMIGKTLFDLVLNVFRTLFVLILAIYGFGASPNTGIFTLLTIALLISLLTMGFGFIISAIGAGVRAVVIIEFFLILFLFAFSGFIIDKELLRGISQVIAQILPWSYGIEIFRRTTLLGQPLLELTSQLQIVCIGIISFYFVSYLLLRALRERLTF